jgi:phage terminase large subunit-like protein
MGLRKPSVKDWRDKQPEQWTRGERNAAWVEAYCVVPEGKDRGKTVRLREWQVDEFRKIYDTPTRTAILSFGRKNGKTALIAFIVLLHLCGPEAEVGSEIVSGARSRDQAAMVFRYASKCARLNPDLSSIVRVRDTAKELDCPQLQTMYKALSADAATNLGRSPKVAIHDELGQVRGPRDEFFEAIDTAQGAHDHPLTLIISTQAPRPDDLLSIMIDDALAESKKPDGDRTVKVSLYTAPMDIDPFSEEALKAANPAYGDFLNAEETRATAEKSRRMPSRESAYRNLILNQRVNMHNPFVTRSVWEANCDPADFSQVRECYIGVDLSARSDLTALVLAGRDEDGYVHVQPYFFAPQIGVEERSQRDREPYDVWARDGFITLTPGASVDYGYVAQQLGEICDAFPVKSIPFDRWRIDVLKQELSRMGLELPLIPFGQGFKDMTPALDTLESLLLDAKIRHGANPVLDMCAENAVATRDPAGNKKLDKSKATGRIDGMVALAMAIGAMNTQPFENKKPIIMMTL